MPFFRRVSEGLARRTSRRGLFGRGADVALGALIGAAAGTLTRPGLVRATHFGGNTDCQFPGPPCACDKCVRAGSGSNGVCAKPCVILTQYYASGCWVVTGEGKGTITCCDCDCQGLDGIGWCGCGSDYHSNAAFCP